jgi:hypothetical protein
MLGSAGGRDDGRLVLGERCVAGSMFNKSSLTLVYLSDRPRRRTSGQGCPPPLRSRTSDRRRPRRYLPLNSLALIFAPRRIMTRPRPCSSRHCSGRCPRRTAGRASASRALPAAAAWRRGTTCFCISVWSAAHGAPSATASTFGPISWVAGTALHTGHKAPFMSSRG